AALAQALKALKNAGVTVVVITHKVNLVQNVDKILFLREGIVERFGKRQEVLANLMEKRKAAVAALEPAE
ncbi:MAG: type I secretion system permease/ATPase, partial [Rhodospirillaceae bacterium]|nr:type I secretion system permease/ATPase [Rhodospirillaceae bacterium]